MQVAPHRALDVVLDDLRACVARSAGERGVRRILLPLDPALEPGPVCRDLFGPVGSPTGLVGRLDLRGGDHRGGRGRLDGRPARRRRHVCAAGVCPRRRRRRAGAASAASAACPGTGPRPPGTRPRPAALRSPTRSRPRRRGRWRRPAGAGRPRRGRRRSGRRRGRRCWPSLRPRRTSPRSSRQPRNSAPSAAMPSSSPRCVVMPSTPSPAGTSRSPTSRMRMVSSPSTTSTSTTAWSTTAAARCMIPARQIFAVRKPRSPVIRMTQSCSGRTRLRNQRCPASVNRSNVAPDFVSAGCTWTISVTTAAAARRGC
ncbi:MAG: hypothetical protein JWR81_5358 [Pseudonocardia sp.]|nr:hypothetical protein [Pseudonocardia sp.]MDT7617390.1 hypothetical protein [Pseudonocardiales bacterium]